MTARSRCNNVCFPPLAAIIDEYQIMRNIVGPWCLVTISLQSGTLVFMFWTCISLVAAAIHLVLVSFTRCRGKLCHICHFVWLYDRILDVPCMHLVLCHASIWCSGACLLHRGQAACAAWTSASSASRRLCHQLITPDHGAVSLFISNFVLAWLPLPFLPWLKWLSFDWKI